MICAALRAVPVADGAFDCLGGPAAAWAWWLAGAVALLSGWLAWRATGQAMARAATAAAFALAAALLALAMAQPVLRQSPGQGEGGRILVLVDRSESFWRDREAATAALGLAAGRIDAFMATRPADERESWRGAIMTFGAAADLRGAETSAANLAAALRGHGEEAPAAASNLHGGLLAGQAWLRGKGGRRMVVLVTDGLADPAVADALLADLAAEGIAVHVVLAGARVPSQGLVAADVGPEHRAGEEVVLRGTVLGAGQLALADGGAAASAAVDGAATLRALRLTTRFAQRGLQGVSLTFETPAGVQQRSLYTLVRGPARILVFGAAPWADALPAARWQVTRADPALPPPPAGHDIVVIDALAPDAFPPGFADDLLAAADGTAVFLVNGPQRGSAEDEQVISDWAAGSLDPILPVDSDPRLFVQDPPPRDIVIMVDVSGSMEGVRLGSAQGAIGAILDQVRPVDTVAILPFSDRSLPVFPQSQATAATLDEARRFAGRLVAQGGTAPAQTIRDSARFASNYCAFFFISDADFAPPQAAPQCFTTAISVSASPFQLDVARWGEEIVLGEGGSIGNFTLRYFEPEERSAYFRPGRLVPTATATAGGGSVPAVDGLAIAYPRADAQVDYVHPAPPPDPVFAWRRDPQRSGIVTGAFLGPMDARWGAEGLAATEAMLERLLGWPDQDRFLIRLTESGAGDVLTVTPVGEPAAALSAGLQWPDGTTTGIALQPDPAGGSFSGGLHRPASLAAGRAMLILQEGAAVQRIPVFFPERGPAAAPAAEALDFGTDPALGRRIAGMTGGSLLDAEPIPTYDSRVTERKRPLHALLVALAIAFLAIAVWSRELRSG